VATGGGQVQRARAVRRGLPQPCEQGSMDWFKGKLKPESPIFLMGKSKVCCKFSQENQSIDIKFLVVQLSHLYGL
jgi:hypothetical protein